MTKLYIGMALIALTLVASGWYRACTQQCCQTADHDCMGFGFICRDHQ